MASSCSSHFTSSIITSTEKKNLLSIDAVLGNDDLITEILLRLPAKAVQKFKFVSKRWFSIISGTSFASRHTHLNSHTVSALLLKVSFSFKKPPAHKYVSLYGKSSVYFSCDFLDFDPSNPGCIYVSQSCNGLLLCSKCRWNFGELSEPINYIFNPTTRQFASLPPPPDDGKYFDSIRLVFDPSESPRYRVSTLRMVSWNDAVHWISPMGNGFSFLLDKERLETIPRPPLPEKWQDQNFRYFGESGGNLHFIGILAGNQNPDVLNMGIASSDMSYDQSNDQSIAISEDEDPTASPFSVKKGLVDLLSFIEGNDEEGPLLVMRIAGEIISYSLKDKTLKKISSLPFKHATYYALSYTETLSYV
ncbi:unnamed protein product [Dovyalis caffra]|uniref:F-box domain-containing protein n=1 Tax=Dovyalis caffra TaxID=77055 RepID=A0AAV1RR60_9ROSI|nr:unnamed protein product [Dovyalis caffra]